MAGKGSKPRPFGVSQKSFADNWTKAFSQYSKRPCLVAINPWVRVYWDAKQKTTSHEVYNK
jgi:hypothetical protein